MLDGHSGQRVKGVTKTRQQGIIKRRDMLEPACKEMAGRAESRANIYRFLSPVFGQELKADLLTEMRRPKFLKALSSLGIDLEEELKKELLKDLEVEYTRLFLGPGKHISPYESVYRGGEGRLYGESSVQVKGFIESLGLGYQPDDGGIPDHIKIELELMQKLTEREKEAWGKEDIKSAKRCLELEKKFIDEHLSQWIPTFCDRVMGEAKLNFYREMARLTRDYVQLEKRQISELLAETEKLLAT